MGNGTFRDLFCDVMGYPCDNSISEGDISFYTDCKAILASGTETESRAIWTDTGEHAKTKKEFGFFNRYHLGETFPILTLRPVNFKNCVDEILWIYQKKSNNIKDLNSHIWDSWADSRGSIGMAYGYQVANQFRRVTNYNEKKDQYEQLILDQTDYVIHELKHNPFSRRILINLYDVGNTDKMGLDPCCYNVTYNVTLDKEGNKVLNCILNQRSNDMLVANNWNVVQYAVLQHLFAHVCDMKVGDLIHVIADAHIYDRHIPIVEDLLKREMKSIKDVKLWINPEIKDFYKFTLDDIRLEGYNPHPQIKNIPVAV